MWWSPLARPWISAGLARRIQRRLAAGDRGVQRRRGRRRARIAYNASVGRPTDFWHLNLPAETRAYVPKLLAMKRLMAEPERYGLEFAPIPNEPYFAVIETESQIDLKIAAQLAGTSYDELSR